MPWWALYRDPTRGGDGTIVSGTSIQITAPAELQRIADLRIAIKAFPARTDGNAPWDPVNLVYLALPAATHFLSPREFARRFTVAEMAGILASTDSTVMQFVYELALPGDIDLTDTRTVNALTYLATHPSGSPLLTPARATAIGTP